MARRIEITDANTRVYGRYNVVGRQLSACLITPSDNFNPLANFVVSVNDHFEHASRVVDDSDMVGIIIHNQVNQSDKQIGISFRRKIRYPQT